MKVFQAVGLFVALSLMVGCSVLKASEAPDSGFLPQPELLEEMRERAPFHRAWIFDKEKYAELRKRYKKIHIKPVNTEYVVEKINKRKIADKFKTQRIEEAEEVARYLENSFKKALMDHPKKPLEVVDKPGPQTFVLELALVELVPTNAVGNAVGTAAGFFIPGSGLIRLAATGSVAIEGLERDGGTNQLLVQFKDREADKNSPFSVKDYQEYAHIRESVSEWGWQYAELAATPLDHTVEDSSPITLNPF